MTVFTLLHDITSAIDNHIVIATIELNALILNKVKNFKYSNFTTEFFK